MPALFLDLVAGKGIEGNKRYFGRTNARTGEPSRRQVTLIEREQIAEHAQDLGEESILPGAVRSNIECVGISLVPWVGRQIQVGEAVLRIAEQRTPCPKMDLVVPGLQKLMFHGRQGVIAEVLKSGRVAVGDAVKVLAAE